MLGVQYGKNNSEMDNGKLLENRHEQDNGFEDCTSLSHLLPVPFTAVVQLDNGNADSHSNTYPDVEQINNENTFDGIIIENNKLIGSPDITDDIDGFSGERDFETDENY
ncbi:unnamed protein product [Timema podura]|uniref:Uncharacterized protein n=1 Tax=Timema podura TaxID=61482 RepID=A0ABN7P785_TIMPD|nr:unnamed protein product [Timema podura]